MSNTVVVGSPSSYVHRSSGKASNRWDKNNKYHLKPGNDRRQEDLTAFDLEVLRLRLQPAQWIDSAELREWVRRWCSSKYVPELLLATWGFESLAEGFKVGWGS